MIEQSEARLSRLAGSLSAGSSLFSTFVGISALCGWMLHIGILRSWLPNQAPVKFNAAICFALLGAALWVLREPPPRQNAALRRAAQIASAGVMLLGALSLLEHLSGWNLGIDQALYTIRPGEWIDGNRPGMIPLIASLDLVLLSASLLALDWKTRRDDWPAQFLAGTATVIASFGLLDFIPGRGVSHTHVALPGGVNFTLLSLGVICARPEWAMWGLLTSPNQGARWLRRAGPLALAVLSVSGYFLSAPLLTPAHLSWTEVSVIGVAAAVGIITFLAWTALLLDRSEQQRLLAQEALRLDATALDHLMGRFDETGIETTVRSWSRIGIALGMVLTSLGFFGFWRSLRQSAQDEDWVVHTHLVRTLIQTTLADCIDVETGSRGFAATGNEAYLGPFAKGEQALPGDVRLLRSVTGDNRSQQKRLDVLEPEIRAGIESAKLLIADRRGTAAVPSHAFAEGKVRTDAIRTTIEEMQAEEDRLLDQRRSDAAASRQRTEGTILLSTLAGIALLAAAGLITNREISRSAKMRDQIQVLNTDLERRVETRTTELRQSEERLRALVNAASDVVYRMSPDWSEMQQLYGQGFIADTSAPSKDWLEGYIPAEEQGLVMQAIQRAIRTKSVFELQHRVRQADGNIGWTFSRAVPRLDANGEIVEWVGMASNVTARKAAEAALRQTQQQVEAIFQSAIDAIISVDEKQRIVMFNPAAEKMLRCPAAEALGQPLNRFIPERFRMGHTKLVDKFGRTGETQRHIGKQSALSGLRADGTEFPAEISISQVEVGGRKLFTAIMRDVSERQQAEKGLRHLAAIVTSSTEAIIAKTLEGVVTSWNHGAETIYGYTADEMIGRSLARVVPPEQIGEFAAMMERVRRGEMIQHFETVRVRKGGQPIDVSLSVSPLKDDAGNVVGVSTISHDVSDRKRAEKELRASRDELARSNRDLEQFAYVASHDLQEPLRMVASYTQLLAERYRGQLDENADKYIDYAVEGAQRMQTLVQDLLNFSRIGRNGRKHASTDCSAILDAALLNLQAAIKESGAEIMHHQLPPVIGDHPQLVQLFQNLVGNAIKFHGGKTPQISISAEKSGKNCVFSVRDNGIGIAPEHAEDIFVIFHRLHTRSEYPGNGMGLAICKKIVEQHGGRIWVESQPGQGAAFKFTLPASAADESSSLEKEVPHHAAASA